MAAASRFTVRPFSRAPRTDRKDAFRIYLSPSALVLLKLRPGDLCVLNQDGDCAPRLAVAWMAPERIQDTVVQTSKTLQEIYGLKLGDKVTITKSGYELSSAVQVVVTEVKQNIETLSNADKPYWEWVLPYHLAKLEVLSIGVTIDVELRGQRRTFKVETLGSPSLQLAAVSDATPVTIGSLAVRDSGSEVSLYVTAAGVGGLSKQLNEINELLRDFGPQDLACQMPAYYQPNQGILIYGAKGTGKTFLVDRIKACPWKKVLTGTGNLLSAAKAALSNGDYPCLIVVDEISTIIPKAISDAHPSQVAVLRELFDLVRGTRTLVVAETRHPNHIDEGLRALGRFGAEIEIPVPTSADRGKILKALRGLESHPTDEVIASISERTHGYVAADLRMLLQQAVREAKRRSYGQLTQRLHNDLSRHLLADGRETSGLEGDTTLGLNGTHVYIFPNPVMNGHRGPSTPEDRDVVTVLMQDMLNALAVIRPTAMQEVFLDTPNIQWSDIGGQHEIKRRLQLAVERPLKEAGTMARLNIQPDKGVLLYGPPGCSKTLLVKALATEAGLNFLAVKGAEVISMYVGESERAVREIFRKARAASPSIIFFDEIDAIASTRKSELNVLTTLLNEMDGFEELHNVLVVAATNKPESIDPALLRPGRFDNIVYVGLPDLASRGEIVELWFKKSQVDAKASDLASLTEGYSGAEIVNVCRTAGGFAMDDKRDRIQWEDFARALTQVKRGISKEVLANYEGFQARGIGR